MKRLALCAITLSFILLPQAIYAQEIRAFWADAFAEGIHTPEQVDTLLRRLRAANCNAIFIQVRKGGDAYYLSHYEPWAADNPQRFDGLAHLIEKAHSGKPRIQVHAWINTCAVGKTHGNPYHIAAAHPEWLSLSDTGETFDGEATKIDPGNPDAADWTARVYLDVARHYDVDGIHFDFVRYGSTDGRGRFGYNPVSVARFNARYGRTGQPAWADPLWKQWRRDQVTALVRKVYAMATAIKPKLTVSAATVTWGKGPRDMAFWNEKSAPMNRVFQDWRTWMEEGILDLNCQMSYYREAQHPDWFRQWIDWGKDHQYKRWVVPSSGIWLNPISDSLKQIEALRKPSKKGSKGRGVLLYSYAGTNTGPDGQEKSFNEEFYASLSQPSSHAAKPPFEKPAEFPKLPWKEKPKTGVVKGFVLTADALNPVDGAKVALTGKVKRTQLTDGTGFYALVEVPPGEYKVRIEARGYAPKVEQVHIDWYEYGLGLHREKAVGSVTRTVMLGQSSVPVHADPRDVYTLPAGSPLLCPKLFVVRGTDSFPGNVYVTHPGKERLVRIRLAEARVLPLQFGDVIAARGTVAEVDGERVLDNATVRLVDIDYDVDFDLMANRPVGLSGAALSARHLMAAEVSGRVTATSRDRFILDDGTPMEVMLTGRKEPDVEAPESPLPAPPEGSITRVTGIVTVTKQPDGKTLIRIRPRSQEDITVLSTATTERLKALARWSALPLAMLLVWLVYSRASLRPREQKRPNY